MILKTIKGKVQNKHCYIQAIKNVYHFSAELPFIKGEVYILKMDSYCWQNKTRMNIISSNSRSSFLKIENTSAERGEFVKYVNKNFVQVDQPNYNITQNLNPKEYKFCVVDDTIIDIDFDTVLYTPKMGVGNCDSEIFYNGYSTILGILKTPVLKSVIKEDDYILKTKIDVLKEIYGEFEVGDLGLYNLKQRGLCVNGWYADGKSAKQHNFTEIFYHNNLKYLSNSGIVLNLLAEPHLISNCFKTKQEAINRLLK